MTDKPGPTGRFPEGKLFADDEGEIRFTVFVRNGNVFLDFGKAVAWLVLPPTTARALAAKLIEVANKLEIV